MPTVRGECVKCGVVKSLRGRGLCPRCHEYHKDEFPRPSYERWDGGNPNPTLPAEPTSAPPGSPEKVAVLCERAEARVALFHPADEGAYDGLVDLVFRLCRAVESETLTGGA